MNRDLEWRGCISVGERWAVIQVVDPADIYRRRNQWILFDRPHAREHGPFDSPEAAKRYADEVETYEKQQ